MTSLRRWLQKHARLLVMLAITAVTYAAAINRYQPILWGVASLLLAGLIIGALMPWWLVNQVAVTRTGPAHTEEDSVIKLSLLLTNAGWAPRFMLEVTDHLPFVAPANPAQSVTLGHIPFLRGHGRRELGLQLVAEKRGLHALGPVAIASRFPLGLVEQTRQMKTPQTFLTVYPKLFPILALPLAGTYQLIDRGLQRLPEAKGTAEFTGLREYQPGDHPKYIHWPSTARNRELMVREFEAMANTNLLLVLDCHPASQLGEGKHTTFEYAVKIAGSLARFASQQNHSFSLSAASTTATSVPAGYGELHFRKILDELATVRADSAITYDTVIENTVADIQAGDTLVLFMSIPESRTRAMRSALTLATDKGARLLAVVFDLRSFDKTIEHATQWHGEMEALGAKVVPISRQSNLETAFNP